jgi:hypothetical protein
MEHSAPVRSAAGRSLPSTITGLTALFRKICQGEPCADGPSTEDQSSFHAAVKELGSSASSKEVLQSIVETCTTTLWEKMDSLDWKDGDLTPLAWLKASSAVNELQHLIEQAKTHGVIPANGRIVISAIEGVNCDEIGLPSPCDGPQMKKSLLAAFQWFLVDFLVGRCGLVAPWKGKPARKAPDFVWTTPIGAAVAFGETGLVRMLAAKGVDCRAAVTMAPAVLAFIYGHRDTFEALLDSGVSLSDRYLSRGHVSDPSAQPLMQILLERRRVDLGGKLAQKARLDIIKMCLAREPTCISVSRLELSHYGCTEYSALASLVRDGPADEELLEALVSAGASLGFSKKFTIPPSPGARVIGTFTWSRDGDADSKLFAQPTLCAALENPDLSWVKLLIERYGALGPDWRSKYTDGAERHLLKRVGELAAIAAGAPDDDFSAHEALKALGLVVDGGVKDFHDGGDNNLVFAALLAPDAEHDESGALRVLEFFKSKGCDLSKPSATVVEDFPSRPDALLSHLAAQRGCRKVLDFALSNGCPVDALSMNKTALALALKNWHVKVAKHLLDKWKAKAALPGLQATDQALFVLLQANWPDGEAEASITRAICRVQPNFLAPEYYPPTPVKRTVVGPVTMAVVMKRTHALEVLLASGLEHVAGWVAETAVVGRWVGSPAQVAASTENLACLKLLLRYCPSLPVTSRHTGPLPHGIPSSNTTEILPSVAELVRIKGCTDRALLARIDSAARKETQAAAAGAVASEVKVFATNAFEDPSTKVLTEAEEKRKAKERAAKKKNKAKKKAAAATKEAHAGAGKEAGHADTDSESGGDDEEEEGMDEEEKMMHRAPVFDLEKEKAARKARAEAEAKKSKE